MTVSDPEPQPPVPWNRDQLALVLLVLFGANRRGGPDTAAAAATLGVTTRSVQRWMRSRRDGVAAIPAARLEQVRTMAQPDEQVRRDEQRTAEYAREALARIALPKGRGILPAWRERQWLDQHLVTVTELAGGIRQVSLTRVTSRSQNRGEHTKGGTILDFCVVATRFHAQLLVHELLQRLAPWRIRGRAIAPKQGATRTWLPGAPEVDLAELAVDHELR